MTPVGHYQVISFARAAISRQFHGVRAGADEPGFVGAEQAEVGAVAVVLLATPLRICRTLKLGLSRRMKDVDVVRLNTDLHLKEDLDSVLL